MITMMMMLMTTTKTTTMTTVIMTIWTVTMMTTTTMIMTTTIIKDINERPQKKVTSIIIILGLLIKSDTNGVRRDLFDLFKVEFLVVDFKLDQILLVSVWVTGVVQHVSNLARQLLQHICLTCPNRLC